MYRLVVCDMDGTLLNSKSELSERNREVLKKLIEKNIFVAIATGRIYTSARIYAKYLGLITPIIACNGAIVKDMADNRIIYDSSIRKEDCLKVFDICKKNNMYFHFYTKDVFYTEKLAESSLKYFEWNKKISEKESIDIRVIPDAYEHILHSDEKVYKIQPNSSNMQLLAKIREKLEEIKTITCSKSWYNNIEVMNQDVSKGNAVKHLAESLGVKREEIICFGDNENDISMLSYAGLGIAMGNAEDIVKQHADYVTTSNDEDGISMALEKFVL